MTQRKREERKGEKREDEMRESAFNNMYTVKYALLQKQGKTENIESIKQHQIACLCAHTFKYQTCERVLACSLFLGTH